MHNDKINPAYYVSKTGIQPVDVIEAFELDFFLGNATKYILRAGKKPSESMKTDLEKAIWYLKRRIMNDNATIQSTSGLAEDVIGRVPVIHSNVPSKTPNGPHPSYYPPKYQTQANKDDAGDGRIQS